MAGSPLAGLRKVNAILFVPSAPIGARTPPNLWLVSICGYGWNMWQAGEGGGQCRACRGSKIAEYGAPKQGSRVVAGSEIFINQNSRREI